MEQIFSKAWELFTQHWKFLIIVAVVGMLSPVLLAIVPYITLMASTIATSDPQMAESGLYTSAIIFAILGFVMTIIMILTQVGLMKSALIITNGGTPTVRDLFLDSNTYLTGFGAGFLCFLMMFFGMIICIVPGIILIFFVSMVPYIILDNPQIGVTEAIGKSFKLIKTDWQTAAIVLFLGGIILNIASVFGYPFVFLLQAVLYRKLKNDFENPTQYNTVPPQYNNQQQYNQQQPPQYNN